MKAIFLVPFLLWSHQLFAESYSYYVKIDDFYGSVSHHDIFEVKSRPEGNGIRKTVIADGPPRTEYEGKADIETVDRLGKFLLSVDWSAEKRVYRNLDVFDGYAVFYEITIGEGETMKFTIDNCYHPLFIELNSRVNRLFPDGHRMYIPKETDENLISIEPRQKQCTALNGGKLRRLSAAFEEL